MGILLRHGFFIQKSPPAMGIGDAPTKKEANPHGRRRFAKPLNQSGANPIKAAFPTRAS